MCRGECACVQVRLLTAWFPRAVHGHFDSPVVGGYLGRSGEHGDGQGEALSPSTPAHEAQVVEAGHLVFHHGGGIPQLGRVVLVVSGHHGDQGPIRNITESDDLKSYRQSLVASPVRWEDGAQEVGAVGPD